MWINTERRQNDTTTRFEADVGFISRTSLDGNGLLQSSLDSGRDRLKVCLSKNRGANRHYLVGIGGCRRAQPMRRLARCKRVTINRPNVALQLLVKVVTGWKKTAQHQD